MQGAIFDMDGTLLDSMGVWKTVSSRILLAHQVTPPPGLYEVCKSLSLQQGSRYLKDRFSLPDSVDALADEANRLVEQDYLERVPLKAHVRPFLEALSQKGVKMCVATATDRYLAQGALERVGILSYFSALYTCSDMGLNKDSPLFLLRCSKIWARRRRRRWSLRMRCMRSSRQRRRITGCRSQRCLVRSGLGGDQAAGHVQCQQFCRM